MIDTRTNTTIYMYAFYSNWSQQDRDIIKSLRFDNLYLGDMEYQHYNYFIDFDKFLKDSYIFAVCSENKNNHYEDCLELISECKNFVTQYDITDYIFNSEDDEIISTSGKKTMIVFNVSGKHGEALREFKQSRFSYMYDHDSVRSLFSNHTNYLVRLKKPSGGYIDVNAKNVDEVFSKIELDKELPNIQVSYYHVLNKSPELRTVLERIYKISLPKEAELKSKLKFETEIYNYEKVMNQDLISTA